MKKIALAAILVLAGCTDPVSPDGAEPGRDGFRVTGKLASPASFAAASIVDRVMAVTPSSQNGARVMAPVDSTGAFSIALDPSRPWVLVFIDSSAVGAAMIAGVFKADALDSLTTGRETGEVDLGDVAVSGGEATGGIAYADLLAALGLDEATASYLGEIDDLCLRYVNPDIDADGVIDMEQADHEFLLDFHVAHNLRVNGQDIAVADLVDAWPDPSTTTVSYGGTGIYVAFPRAFASDLSAAWVSFEQAAHYQTFGPGGGAGSADAFAHISGEALIVNDFGDYRGFGIYAPPGYEMPQGVYTFGVEEQTLSFTRVATRSDAELATAENFLMPLIRLEKADPACVGDCVIGSISYKWVKENGGTWVDATESEVALVIGGDGGYLGFRKSFDDSTQWAGVTIPAIPVSGSISWASAHLDGMTEAELDAITSSQICHVGMSYDDQLGMRMFSGIRNTEGTCPMSP